LNEIKCDKSCRGEAKAKAAGLFKQGKQYQTYFGLKCCYELFSECESVARKLQGQCVTAKGAQESIDVSPKSLKKLITDATVQNLLKDTEKEKKNLVCFTLL